MFYVDIKMSQSPDILGLVSRRPKTLSPRLRGNTVVTCHCPPGHWFLSGSYSHQNTTLHTGPSSGRNTGRQEHIHHGLSHRHEEGEEAQPEGEASVWQLRAGREAGDVDSSDEQNREILPGQILMVLVLFMLMSMLVYVDVFPAGGERCLRDVSL